MQDIVTFVLVDGDAFTIANLTGFFAFSLVLASVVLIVHTFVNGRNYR